MIAINNVSDYIHEQVSKMATHIGYFFSDQPLNDNNSGITKIFNIHRNSDTVFPVSKINLWLLQLYDDLIQEAKDTKCIHTLSVEGPVDVPQKCFINRNQHNHLVWNICLTYGQP